MQLIWSLVTGIICGIVFATVGLPIPAPPVLAGIAGILGIWIGYMLVGRFK